jgi:SAM-dependent methyltransferase
MATPADPHASRPDHMGPDDWDRRYAGDELVWDAPPNRTVAEECAGLPAGTALDLACGEGRNAVWLAVRGWDVIAVDFSPVALDKGRRLAAGNGIEVDWQEEDLARWTPPAGRFDLVLWCYLQVPEPDRTAMVGRAWSAVTPGGTFLLVAHDADNLERGWGGPRSPAVLTTVDGVVAALGPGADVERAEVVRRPVATPEGDRVALDTLVKARRADGAA